MPGQGPVLELPKDKKRRLGKNKKMIRRVDLQ